MKLSITAILIAALTATTVTAKTDQQKCQKKNGHVVEAIQKFCSKTNIVTPSTYAIEGTNVGTGGPMDAKISIQGNCSPAQWIPQKYCLSQLYNMCANSGDGTHGDSEAYYGKNGCQDWLIDVGQSSGHDGGNGSL